MHDAAMDVGQPEFSSGVEVRQPFVVKPKQMQDRRLQIVNVDRIVDDVKAEIIG